MLVGGQYCVHIEGSVTVDDFVYNCHYRDFKQSVYFVLSLRNSTRGCPKSKFSMGHLLACFTIVIIR